MNAARADTEPKTRAAYAAASLVGLCCAAFAFSPNQIGVLALVVSACLVALPRRRVAALEALAVLGFMAFMFGPSGAGGFAMMHLLVVIPVSIGLRGVRPVIALAIAAAIGATVAVCAAYVLADVAPTRWAAFAPMAPAFLLAAPALVLRRMAAWLLVSSDADTQRLQGLGPLLVALVVGAGIGGLHAAAVGWASAQLGLPLAALLLSRRGTARASLAFGVLAAGFVAALATDAALTFAHASPLAVLPAVVIGLMVFMLGLRAHAPMVGRHLARVAGRYVPAARAGASGSTRDAPTPTLSP